MVPYRWSTVERIQEKVSAINLLIELWNQKKYQDIKDELITEIAELDINIEANPWKIAILNKMAEVVVSHKSEYPKSRKLSRYNFLKMDITEST